MKKIIKGLAIILSIALFASIGFFSFKSYQIHVFNELEEYKSYTTQNGKYTVSLRDKSEPGLSDAIRLDVYLVDNDSGYVKCVDEKRLDFYNDFTPYVEFTENGDVVVITFHTKNSESEINISV
jgi:hypothetical protein